MTFSIHLHDQHLSNFFPSAHKQSSHTTAAHTHTQTHTHTNTEKGIECPSAYQANTEGWNRYLSVHTQPVVRGRWAVKAKIKPFFPWGKDPVSIVPEWPSGPVWKGRKNLSPIWVRTPERLTRNQSLHRLLYRAPLLKSQTYQSHVTEGQIAATLIYIGYQQCGACVNCC
jgi:hypothetical protein